MPAGTERAVAGAKQGLWGEAAKEESPLGCGAHGAWRKGHSARRGVHRTLPLLPGIAQWTPIQLPLVKTPGGVRLSSARIVHGGIAALFVQADRGKLPPPPLPCASKNFHAFRLPALKPKQAPHRRTNLWAGGCLCKTMIRKAAFRSECHGFVRAPSTVRPSAREQSGNSPFWCGWRMPKILPKRRKKHPNKICALTCGKKMPSS